MRKLTKCEVAAMWLWGAEYAKGGLSAIGFYAQLSLERKRLIDEMVREITEAPV